MTWLIDHPHLFHPLIIHFPIALYFLSFILKILSLVKKNPYHPLHSTLSLYFLYTAVILHGFAIYSGDFAYEQTKNSVTDLTIVYEHEEHAYISLYFFLATAVVSYFLQNKVHFKIKEQFVLYIKILILTLFTLGISQLAITSHYGAKLVYEQGVGAIKPSDN